MKKIDRTKRDTVLTKILTDDLKETTKFLKQQSSYLKQLHKKKSSDANNG